MSILNTTNTPIGISIATTNPTTNDNMTAGYVLTQEWFNKTTGERFYHKSDGVWVSYDSKVAAVVPDDAPVYFANLATTDYLPYSPVYYNGAANDGVGATLTATSNGVLTIDGQVADLGMTILVKNGITAGTYFDEYWTLEIQNGVYDVVQKGTISAPYILMRSTFSDESDEIYPSQINVLEGSINRDRFFLQQTESPVVGTSGIYYVINYVPPTQVINLPVVQVDTVTSMPLPTCIYSNTYPESYPNQPWYIGRLNYQPSGATLTGVDNGPLPVINGVQMYSGYTASTYKYNTRILVKDQASPIQNGDYQLIENGSPTRPWKLRRITTTWTAMDKDTREWKVNNPESTKYGYRYSMGSTAGPKYRWVGNSPISFYEKYYISEILVSGLLTGGGTSSSITIGTDPTIATGSGVFGYVPYWNSAQNLSSTSSIYNVGTNVGISNFSPTHPLTIGSSASGIGGQISLQGRTSGNVVIKTSDVTSSWTASLPTTKGSITPFVYSNFGGEIMLNDGNGNLFFGTTPSLSLSENTVFIGNTYGYAKSRVLMGDIYSDYTGTITINNGVVSYQKMQTVSQPALLGSTIAGGPVTEIPYFDFFIPLGTIATNLENVSNWSAGAYIGPAITGTYQGQSHYDSSYYFMAVEDNQWIRILRA